MMVFAHGSNALTARYLTQRAKRALVHKVVHIA